MIGASKRDWSHLTRSAPAQDNGASRSDGREATWSAQATVIGERLSDLRQTN